MKKIVLITAACLIMHAIWAQEESPVDMETSKNLTKEERKQQRLAEEAAYARMVEWMVYNRQFVLEANYLSNTPYNKTIVDSRLNFIKVDSAQITIQLASSTGVGGLNGMGGLTTDGNISIYNLNRTGKKKDFFTLRISSMTSISAFDIFFTIYPSGNANATISGYSGTKLHYEGKIVPVNRARIYKAMSL